MLQWAVFLIATVICLNSPLMSQTPNPSEWPILHNVRHTGFSATTVLKPPLKLKWAARVPGAFKAGPVVAESCMVAQDRSGYLFCFNANTGNLLWRYFVQGIVQTRKIILSGETYFPSTETGPCIWNGRVYAANYCIGDPEVSAMRCFDIKNGNLLWKKRVGGTNHRIHYSPQVSNGRLFYCSNVEQTGKTWAQAGYSAANLSYKAQVQCWNALTGDSIWTYTLLDTICDNTTLLVSGDTVFASAGFLNNVKLGRTVALDIDIKVLWSTDSFYVNGNSGNLQVVGSRLFIPTQKSTWQGLMQISTIDWTVAVRNGGGCGYSKVSPIMNGKYYSRDYATSAYPYDLATGTRLPFTITNGPADAYSGCAAPVAANGIIYNHFGNPKAQSTYESGNRFTGVDESGRVVWQFEDNSNHCASVAVAYDCLYGVAGAEGMVYCFENAR